MRKSYTLNLILILCSVVSNLPLVRAAEGSWTTLAEMPMARGGHGTAVVGNEIFVMGGSFGEGTTGNNEVYDPLTNTWTTKSSIPAPRSAFGIAAVENKIYVIGGSYTGNSTSVVNEVYDPSTDTWETRNSMPTSRAYVVANEVNGKIYVMAGFTFPNPIFPTLCNKTEVYDPVTDSWSEKEQMPDFTGLGYGENVASAVIDNKIYVTVAETLHIYNTENDSWSLGTSVPTTIHGGAVMGATTGEWAPKRLYLFGGYGYQYGNTLNLTRVYNPEENVWSYGAQMPTPRFGHAVAVVGDRLYLIGGTVGENVSFYSLTALNEQYTPLGYIPEFPSWIILPLLLVATLFGIIVRRKIRIF